VDRGFYLRETTLVSITDIEVMMIDVASAGKKDRYQPMKELFSIASRNEMFKDGTENTCAARQNVDPDVG
jgi:hypothetical protein